MRYNYLLSDEGFELDYQTRFYWTQATLSSAFWHLFLVLFSVPFGLLLGYRR